MPWSAIVPITDLHPMNPFVKESRAAINEQQATQVAAFLPCKRNFFMETLPIMTPQAKPPIPVPARYLWIWN